DEGERMHGARVVASYLRIAVREVECTDPVFVDHERVLTLQQRTYCTQQQEHETARALCTVLRLLGSRNHLQRHLDKIHCNRLRASQLLCNMPLNMPDESVEASADEHIWDIRPPASANPQAGERVEPTAP